MSRHLSIAMLAMCTFAPIAAGCGDDDGPPQHEASCDRACARAHECSSSVDEADCAMDCKDDTAEIGPNLRGDFLAALDSCTADLTCIEFAGAAVFQTCQREATARVAPSDAAVDLCDAVVDTIKECTGLTVGTAGCLDGVKVFHDTALTRAQTCEAKSCDQRVACLRDQLGIDVAGM
jgi:hypothetical protein